MIDQKRYSQQFLNGNLTLGHNPANIFEQPNDHQIERFYRERAQYYYGMYSANQSMVGYGGAYKGRSFRTLRDHARGLMDMDKYMDFIDPKKKKGRDQGKRKLNISKRPAMYLTKYRDIMRSKFDGVNVEPTTVAVDELARQEKELEYSKMKFLARPETASWLQSMNIPVQQGMEAQDIDVYETMGGVRLGVEIMMKDALDVSKNVSGWDILNPMLIEDMVDLNSCAVTIIKDRNTGRLRYKYVDPARMGMRNSIYPDARDTDFKFFIETINISTIRAESDLDEEEIKKIERMYKGRNGNPNGIYTSDYYAASGTRDDYANNTVNTYQYNSSAYDYKVDIMTLYFIDTQVQRWVDGVHEHGNRIFQKVGLNSKLSGRDKKNKKIISVPMHNVYTCKWVVGTDYVYDYGLDHTVVREGGLGTKVPVIPIITFVGQEPSLIERCIGFDDDIQLATLKIRSMISKLPPGPRMIFDKTAMKDSITIGDETYSVLDMLSEWQTSGYMFVETRGEAGIPGVDDDYAKRKPFTFVETGIIEDIKILYGEIQKGLEGIRQVTGVNPISDGTNQQGDMLKSVMAGMNAATNNALLPHIKNYVATIRRLYEVNMRKWQLLILKGEITVDNLPVGDQMFKNIKITKEIHNRDMGVFIDMMTVEDREVLIGDLMSKKDIIGPDIYYVVFNAIKDGDIKKAQLILAKHTKDAQQIAHNRQLELVNAQTKGNTAASQAAEKAKQDTLVVEYDQKIRHGEAMHNLNVERDKEKAASKTEGDVTKETVKAAVSPK